MATHRPSAKKTPVVLRGTAKTAAPSATEVSELAVSEPEVEDAEFFEPVAEVEKIVAAISVEAPEVNSQVEAWRKKTLDLWSENASAWLDFATEIGKGTNPAEVATLQTQFVYGRFNALLQATNDYLALARETALSAYPKGFTVA